MEGRAFLDSARLLLSVPSEANRRSAAGRVYLALLREAQVVLARLGFPRPSTEDVHGFVLDRIGSAAHLELARIADAIRRSADLQAEADYKLEKPGNFADDHEINFLLAIAQATIELLDELDADFIRRTAAMAVIRFARP